MVRMPLQINHTIMYFLHFYDLDGKLIKATLYKVVVIVNLDPCVSLTMIHSR
jgi:hypothetical protein